MVESILSSSQTKALFARTNAQEARNQAAERLATGQKVNKITDNPKDYLLAKALSERVGTLQETKQEISQGIETLRATQAGTQAVEDLSNQLKGIALSAKDASATEKAELAKQFNTVKSQLDNLVNDTSYQGKNLIGTGGSDLTVDVGDKSGGTLTVSAKASDSASLGIKDASADYNDFATQADIDAAIADIDAARTTIRSTESTIGANVGVLQTRERFSQQLANIHEEGASKLTEADLNEEAAKQLSAGVRDGLAGAAQRIAAKSEASVLELVRGGK